MLFYGISLIMKEKSNASALYDRQFPGLLQISEWKGDRQGTPFPYDGHCRAIKNGV